MSRIGRMPIAVPNAVSAELLDSKLTVKGPRGELAQAHTVWNDAQPSGWHHRGRACLG